MFATSRLSPPRRIRRDKAVISDQRLRTAFDSCAPAHLKLAPFPTRSLLPSQFCLLCRFPKSSVRPLGFPIYAWHAVASAKEGRSHPYGSIRSLPALARCFALITRTARACACYLAALPSTRAVPYPDVFYAAH